MAIYSPFSSTAWFSLTNLQDFGMTAAFYLVALAIMLISKLIMYNSQAQVNFNLWKYILWIIAEVIIISIFYTHFTYVFVTPSEESLINIMAKSFGCILLIIAIPYTILTLYAAYKAKAEELQMLQYEMSLSNESSMVYPSLINFYDYNGTLKLTINSDSLYYMESQDNYIKIHYENSGKLCSYMLRSRTKTIEESLADTSIVRCQRSYLVNVMKINHIKKGGKARYIVLSHDDIRPIPVSKSYFKNLISKIDKYNSAALKNGQHPAALADVSETIADDTNE
ncbi:MAG: LytTR family transcriptional regulator [Alistipes sp.]|nr:LytTR family transcriptional regulator [Alistipes sp.]MBR3911546.1 LytTR family transcriptional regulator [Alistipes sp.]